jgi:hypothetical protein
MNSGMIEEKQGYYLVTAAGKNEFTLQSTASRSNLTMVVIGVAMIFFTLTLKLGILPIESVLFFGVTLILIGSLFFVISRKSKPSLPSNAKVLLKELNRR